MKIRILGGGWYGCHLAYALQDEHEVLLVEPNRELFRGASGANPARLHIGPHYPRSRATRQACQAHSLQFLEHYGELTRPIGRNIYAIAKDDSLIDFGNFWQCLRSEIEMLRVYDTAELGLRNVEGAVQVNERHLVINKARAFFTEKIRNKELGADVHADFEPADLMIDCTFCQHDAQGVDRYEPCATLLLNGPTDQAITIMDGPFPSLYPWDEEQNLCSLTSALHTPLTRSKTWAAAAQVLREFQADEQARAKLAAVMIEQMANFYPRVRETHRYVDVLTGIRAMPRSGAAARLVQVLKIDPKLLRIRAGKIDAVFEAERQVREHIRDTRGW